MEYILALGVLAGAIFVYRSLAAARRTREMAAALQALHDNPSLLEGLPLVYVEEATEISGQIQLLAYEILSNKFICQATDMQLLAAKLKARWPNEPVYLKAGDDFKVVA